MFHTPRRVAREYQKWHTRWDSLCVRCGKCCYKRSRSSKSKVQVDYSSPCEFLDEETRLCRVYETRFRDCGHCGKLTLFRALFYPLLPPDCAYARTFRVWAKKGGE